MNPLTSWIEAHGGLVGLGVELAKYSLILFSILSLAIIVERVIALRRVRALEDARFPDTRDFLRADQLFEGAAPCQKIAAAGWERRSQPLRMREAMERQTTLEIAALSFNLPILATAASTAPYIGLFGTVLGILAAFRQIAASGQTGAAVIAGGISEALTATALGLGVAIPAVLSYNYFSGRINALALEIEAHAEELASAIETTWDERHAERPAARKSVTRETADREADEREILERETADREVGDRQTLEREIAARQALEREIAARQALDFEVANRGAANGESARRKVVNREAASREAGAPAARSRQARPQNTEVSADAPHVEGQ